METPSKHSFKYQHVRSASSRTFPSVINESSLSPLDVFICQTIDPFYRSPTISFVKPASILHFTLSIDPILFFLVHMKQLLIRLLPLCPANGYNGNVSVMGKHCYALMLFTEQTSPHLAVRWWRVVVRLK